MYNQSSPPTPMLRLGIAGMNARAKKGKNNEMGLPSMRKCHTMPELDLESIHKAFLARIFKTKIEIVSSMIYKIALERRGKTQDNKKQGNSLIAITRLGSGAWVTGRETYERGLQLLLPNQSSGNVQSYVPNFSTTLCGILQL